MLIRIRYNAERFPRVIILPNHKKQVFHSDRRELDFEENDAYILLKDNARISLGNWEFSIIGIIDEKRQEPLKETEFKAETPILAPETGKRKICLKGKNIKNREGIWK